MYRMMRTITGVKSIIKSCTKCQALVLSRTRKIQLLNCNNNPINRYLGTSCSLRAIDTEHDFILSRLDVHDFLIRLDQKERDVLYTALTELHDAEQLLMKEQGTIPRPTREQLRAVGIHNALPFIGFGFLDNFIMIVAGDYIDVTIGAALGITTLAAAALGNMVSDVAGLGSAWYVESLAYKVGIKAPRLAAAQLEMKSTRWTANIGRAVGVSLGCLLGMVPLLFHKSKRKDKTEEDTKTN